MLSLSCRKCLLAQRAISSPPFSLRLFHFSRNTFPHTALKSLWRALDAENFVRAAPPGAQPYLRLMRVDKPIGTWLLFMPCTWSIGLATPAGHLPDAEMLAIFFAGAFLMRSAGCVINDLWDRDFDRKVQRTKSRPLASGEIDEKHAIALLGVLLSASLTILLQLNWLSVFIGASSMALVISYPLAKRYTYWPQLILGCTFNWGAFLGYTASSSHFHAGICLPLYLCGLSWTLIYDTIYAHQDKLEDVLIGVKSTALLFGDNTRMWLSGFATTMILNLALVGLISAQTWPFYAALAGTSAHLAWQIGTLNIDDSADCARKFRANQQLGLLLFLGIVLSNLLKSHSSIKKD